MDYGGVMIKTRPAERLTIGVWIEEGFRYRVWQSWDGDMKVYATVGNGLHTLPKWLVIA